jgi:serine/threonine protein phosphatase PrpC
VRGELGAYWCLERPGEAVCIAISRALGNFAKVPFGVTHMPSLAAPHVLRPDQRHCVFVASDGVWDVWKFDELAARVQRCVDEGMDAQRLCDTLVAESVAANNCVYGPEHRDDISCVAWLSSAS